MTETTTFKCKLTLDKWLHYYAVFVMMKNKQTLYLSGYYKDITHVPNFLLYHLKLLQCMNNHNRTDRLVPDKEDSLTDVFNFTVTCN